ncbi:hypothetical protein AC1031_007958 [Aphanomyces cochlioides]|nr:hypothetical protein AC1031_007958 [Aphanomyces cochlioides]
MERPTCFFDGCEEPVGVDSWRCVFHRGRNQCTIPNCRRQAYAKKLCARHGGRSKCSVEGCLFRVRSGGVCATHGVKRKPRVCRVPGCGNSGQSHGHCIKHGGVQRCKVVGCTTFARTRGVCFRHNRLFKTKTADQYMEALADDPIDIPLTEVEPLDMKVEAGIDTLDFGVLQSLIDTM